MSSLTRGAPPKALFSQMLTVAGGEPVLKVGDFMASEVYTLLPEDTVYAAAELLLAARVSAAPVVDRDGSLVGMLTLTDLLYRAEVPHSGKIADAVISWLGGDPTTFKKAVSTYVRDVMTTPVICIGPDDTLQAAATKMLEKRIHQLPVVEEDKLVGIVSRSDVIGALVAWVEKKAGFSERGPSREGVPD